MKHTPKTRVFLLTGQEAVYVAPDGQGHIVRPLYEAHRGDQEYMAEGDLTSVAEVFKKPPTAKLHAEVLALNRQIEDGEARLATISEQEHEIAEGQRERMKRLKKHDALKLIDDFLDGKITHLVTGCAPDDDNIEIIDVASKAMGCADNIGWRRGFEDGGALPLPTI